MRLTNAVLVIGAAFLTMSCSKEEEKSTPAFERAQEELKTSIEEARVKVAEGAAEARKAIAAAREQWDELRPEAERAIASVESRVKKLVNDSDALKRLPPDVLEQVRAHLDTMRRKLAEAKAAHEQGDTDLAVEKADAVQQERAAVEELLVERPDSPTQGAAAR